MTKNTVNGSQPPSSHLSRQAVLGAASPTVSPVLQFVLLLTPMVMTCFYMVYALTGWVVEGRDKETWAIEAQNVAIWVGAGIALYSVLVMLLARFKGVWPKHILVYSSFMHIAIALLLTLSIFVCVRL